jgi:hypothetical protein
MVGMQAEQGDEAMENAEATTEVRAGAEALEPQVEPQEMPAPEAQASEASAAAPAPAGDQPQATRVGRGQGAWLAARILDPERRLPVVAVTLPPRREESWMDMPRLARLLVGKAELFLVETGAATWELAAALPSRLDVYGGAARIWWPGVTATSDPYQHPLVFAWGPDDGESATRRILKLVGAEDPDAPRPHGGGAAQGAVAQAIELMQTRAAVTRLEHENKVLARELEHVREERARLIDDRRLLRDSEQRLRRQLRELTGQDSDPDTVGLDPLDSLPTFLSELFSAFGRLYPAVGPSPVKPQLVRLHAEFLDSARSAEDLRPARVLEAASHVAAGKSFEVAGLSAGPLPSGVEGAPQQVRASDGARAWRCTIPGSGWSLRWWVLPGVPGGAVELACVRPAVDLSIPE